MSLHQKNLEFDHGFQHKTTNVSQAPFPADQVLWRSITPETLSLFHPLQPRPIDLLRLQKHQAHSSAVCGTTNFFLSLQCQLKCHLLEWSLLVAYPKTLGNILLAVSPQSFPPKFPMTLIEQFIYCILFRIFITQNI